MKDNKKIIIASMDEKAISTVIVTDRQANLIWNLLLEMIPTENK